MRSDRISIMIAQATRNTWATNLADSLSTWPVDLHWPRTDREAISLITDQPIHVGVVDYDLPQTTGLDLVRRMRQMGVATPCLLVCGDASQRVLLDALELDIFSVVQADSNRDLIVPMVVKVVQQTYSPSWPAGSTLN